MLYDLFEFKLGIEISGHRAMPERSQVEIADLVRETRQRLGLTQTQLAQELGSRIKA